MSLRLACRRHPLLPRPRPPLRPHPLTRASLETLSFSTYNSHLFPTERNTRPSYELVKECPAPTCSCAAMPELPEGMPIDTTSKMGMPYYDRHVVVGGEQGDAQAWPSKLEAEESSMVKRIKEMLGPKGEFYRPDFSVSVTASTLPGSTSQLYIFPDFVRVSLDSASSPQTYLPPLASTPLRTVAKFLINDNELDPSHFPCVNISKPVILICGHGQRDQRCGILGPILQAEFERHWRRCLIKSDSLDNADPESAAPLIAQVSHVGGHKFAGNVVVYIPPGYRSGGMLNELEGKSVWYGRVEPKHVMGILTETLGEGRVIGELLRGVHDFGKEWTSRSERPELKI